MESERENSELAHAILVTNVKISEDEDELEQHVHCTIGVGEFGPKCKNC